MDYTCMYNRSASADECGVPYLAQRAIPPRELQLMAGQYMKNVVEQGTRWCTLIFLYEAW